MPPGSPCGNSSPLGQPCVEPSTMDELQVEGVSPGVPAKSQWALMGYSRARPLTPWCCWVRPTSAEAPRGPLG